MDISNLPPIPNGFKLKDSGSSTATASKLPPIPDGFKLQGGDPQGESGDDWMSKSFPKTARNNLSKLYQGGANSPALKKAQYDVEAAKSRTNPVMTTLKGLSDTADKMSNPFNSIPKMITGKNLSTISEESSKHTPFTDEQKETFKQKWGMYPTKEDEMSAADQLKTIAAMGIDQVNAGNLIFGKVLESGGAIAPKVGQAISASKVGQAWRNSGKFVTDTIKRIKPDYVPGTVIPDAVDTFKGMINKGTSGFHSFLERKGIIPKSASETLKQFGEEDIKLTSDKNLNSTDPIVNRIQNGIIKKRELADKTYKGAVENFNGNINSTGFYRNIEKSLQDKGWVDADGKPTVRYKAGLSPTYDKLTDLYSDMTEKMEKTGLLDSGGKPILKTTTRIPGEKIITKEDFSTYRDALSDMLKEKPSDIAINKARSALYDAAENSGMKGIKQARTLYREAEQFEKDVPERLLKEGNLDKYHTWTEADKKSLQNVEKYTGESFIDDLKKISAQKHIDNIGQKISTIITKAENPRNTSGALEELKNIVGQDNANRIIKEVVAARRTKIAAGVSTAGGIFELGRKSASGRW